ncbi:response regulator transcription factor [Geodermatophilus marinus]|uniref:response regulator transcription factor n=1 Tax=Geodermatophilus sp. LHW52908 TaxID=2303986 RepID=UPI000E3EA65D|nr:response regulator transcription factor [Geodermatophilus sp. LHW52908]RFU21284.1 DNA-binding response regulator [Geodermatophilus sp. LHW52908]
MRLVVCDDHRMFAEPFAMVLTARGHDVVVVSSPAEVVTADEGHHADLVVVDRRFPDGDGLEAVARLHARRPSRPVVVLSGSSEDGDRFVALEAGAAAFLDKVQPMASILRALEACHAGRVVRGGTPAALARPADQHADLRAGVQRLTPREREVLRRLVDAEGTTNIAAALGVSRSTARTHLQNVLLKLGARTRLQAVTAVVAAGLDGEL